MGTWLMRKRRAGMLGHERGRKGGIVWKRAFGGLIPQARGVRDEMRRDEEERRGMCGGWMTVGGWTLRGGCCDLILV